MTAGKLYNDSVPGWLGPGDMEVLYTIAKTVPNDGIIVEVGSMHGKSACCLASVAETSTVYSFDIWSGTDILASDGITRLNTIEKFIEYTSRYHNIIPRKVEFDLRQELDNTAVVDIKYEWDGAAIDLLFIDAAHTNPTDWQCIEYWLPKIKSGGMICGHDYHTIEIDGIVHFPDVVENVGKLEKMLGVPVTHHKWTSIWSFVV